MSIADAPSPRAPNRSTHEVSNQPPPLSGYDTFASDAALVDSAQREGAGWARDRLHALGRVGGSEEAIAWGFEANESPPVLHTHDRYGHRIDEVAYHPSYHRLMEVAIAHGLHSYLGASRARAPTSPGPRCSSPGASTQATAARSR